MGVTCPGPVWGIPSPQPPLDRHTPVKTVYSSILQMRAATWSTGKLQAFCKDKVNVGCYSILLLDMRDFTEVYEHN